MYEWSIMPADCLKTFLSEPASKINNKSFHFKQCLNILPFIPYFKPINECHFQHVLREFHGKIVQSCHTPFLSSPPVQLVQCESSWGIQNKIQEDRILILLI